MTDPEFLTVPEVATRMRVSTATIRRLIEQGDLPAVKFGKQYRVEADQLAATINHHRTSRPLVVRPAVSPR